MFELPSGSAPVAAFVAVPGAVVGARRWPGSSGHPSVWAAPHRGLVLDICDRRAWANRCLGKDPEQSEVDAYVSELKRRGELCNSLPVLWDFSSVGCSSAVMWEFIPNLKPYSEDCALWEQARGEAMNKEASNGSHHV